MLRIEIRLQVPAFADNTPREPRHLLVRGNGGPDVQAVLIRLNLAAQPDRVGEVRGEIGVCPCPAIYPASGARLRLRGGKYRRDSGRLRGCILGRLRTSLEALSPPCSRISDRTTRGTLRDAAWGRTVDISVCHSKLVLSSIQVAANPERVIAPTVSSNAKRPDGTATMSTSVSPGPFINHTPSATPNSSRSTKKTPQRPCRRCQVGGWVGHCSMAGTVRGTGGRRAADARKVPSDGAEHARRIALPTPSARRKCRTSPAPAVRCRPTQTSRTQ